MKSQSAVFDQLLQSGNFFVAGQWVPPGIYLQVDAQREVRLESEGLLPASCDGHVAFYVYRPDIWSDRHDDVDSHHEAA